VTHRVPDKTTRANPVHHGNAPEERFRKLGNRAQYGRSYHSGKRKEPTKPIKRCKEGPEWVLHTGSATSRGFP